MTTPAARENISIREMQPADAPAVSELAQRIWRAHYPGIITHAQIEYMLERMSSPDALVQLMKDQKQRFWLLYDGAALAGYLAAEPIDDRGTWYIDKYYIDPLRHGKGLGTALFYHMLREVLPKALTLRVNRQNIKAINFYFKMGFTIESIIDTDIGGGFAMEDFIMKRAL